MCWPKKNYNHANVTVQINVGHACQINPEMRHFLMKKNSYAFVKNGIRRITNPINVQTNQKNHLLVVAVSKRIQQVSKQKRSIPLRNGSFLLIKIYVAGVNNTPALNARLVI